MKIGKVIGNVVSTRKNENLIGCKFMTVEPLKGFGGDGGNIIAVDNVGAGIGELVIIATGSAARTGTNMENMPVDAAIVGIVDSQSNNTDKK